MTATQEKTANLIRAYQVYSKQDAIRKANMIARLYADMARADDETDSGLYGKCYEIACHPSNSKIVDVRPQGKVDCYYRINGKMVRAEIKTNEGRLETMNWDSKDYIVYHLCYEKPQGKPKKDGSCRPAEWIEYTVCLKICDFIAKLKSVDGIKYREDGAILVKKTNAKVHKMLSSIEMDCYFDRTGMVFAE